MSTINALEFSQAGDRYLGRSYEEMDCQAFVEKCMADCGYRKDLGGSNSWYRECLKNGWAGTPEECLREFGLIPKGALLFIREDVSGSTPGKFRSDGIGDITHMGIKTGRGEGAIHSSKSRGGVVTSKFKDKTIPNGGWNRVGLLKDFQYENPVNWVMEHSDYSAASGQTAQNSAKTSSAPTVQKPLSTALPQSAGNTVSHPEGNTVSHLEGSNVNSSAISTKKEGTPMMVTVTAPSGSTVNLRQKPNKGAALVERVPIGAEVELLGSSGDWSRVKYRQWVGWMMTEFLIADDSAAPPEAWEDDPPSAGTGTTYSVIISGLDLAQAQAIAGMYPGNSEIAIAVTQIKDLDSCSMGATERAEARVAPHEPEEIVG